MFGAIIERESRKGGQPRSMRKFVGRARRLQQQPGAVALQVKTNEHCPSRWLSALILRKLSETATGGKD